MKTGVRTITYAVADPKTYLVAVLESGVVPMDFCVRMAERNRIPGLLPMHQQIDDGDTALYFDITGKRRLRDVIREAGERQLIMLLSSLTRALQGLPDYFLRAGQCLLEPDCTFTDSQGNVYLPLVPLTEDQQDSNMLLRSYLAALMGEYVPEGGAPSPKVAALIGSVIKTDFTLEGFAALLSPAAAPEEKPVRREIVRAPIRPAAPIVPAAAVPQEIPEQKDKSQSVEPVSAAPNVGFAIPGMEGVQIPVAAAEPAKKKEKKKKEKPEKEKKSFGFLGWKKESKVDMDKEAHMVSAAIPPASKPAYVPAVPAFVPEQQGGGQWSGTVQLAGQGATEFMNDASDSAGAALLHSGRRLTLTSQPFTIGRVNCSYIVDNPKVSRTHATILQESGRYLIRDENSSNHTYINGVMIPPYTPVQLENGCEIRLGSEEFRFVLG